MWRRAQPADDAEIVEMCLALNAEDPGPKPVTPHQVLATLGALRAEPARGRAVVLEIADAVVGYALLIAFWSNELGGEVCHVDEVFVAPRARNQGHATTLFEHLRHASELWTGAPAALALEVRPDNHRALTLYKRLGFSGGNLALKLQLLPGSKEQC